MKTEQVNIRTSPEDKRLLKKAVLKLQDETGEKQNASETIRAAVKKFADSKPDLFFINRPAIREAKINIEHGLARLQVVIDEFLKITGKYIIIDELQNCMSGLRRNFLAPNTDFVRELVITKLIEGKSGEIAGLQLSEGEAHFCSSIYGLLFITSIVFFLRL